MAAGKEAGNGVHPATTETPQAPRRLVLLDGEPHGEAEQVLVEYPPSAAIGAPHRISRSAFVFPRVTHLLAVAAPWEKPRT